MIMVIGVAGSGKTTVGEMLADAMKRILFDARCETPCLLVEGNRLDDRANDPFEPVELRTCTNSCDRVRPLRAMTNAYRVVVTVRKTESHHEDARAVSVPKVSISSLRSRPSAAALRITTR